MKDDPGWLSIKDIAATLGVSRALVRKWLHAGQFDEYVVMNQRVIRISRASYHRFIEKQKRSCA